MYTYFFFDCDGVLLNSNHIKSNGFYYAAEKYGENNAKKLLEYHKLNGGISRYHKFKYFIQEILNQSFQKDLYDDLLKKYSFYVNKEILKCEISRNLKVYRKQFSNSKWYVVSGGDQKELINNLTKRSIGYLFDGGIFGSPKNKFEILKDILPKKVDQFNTIFLGDSLYDFRVAKHFNMSFRYISKWSEYKDIFSHAKKNQILVHNDLDDFFQDIQG